MTKKLSVLLTALASTILTLAVLACSGTPVPPTPTPVPPPPPNPAPPLQATKDATGNSVLPTAHTGPVPAPTFDLPPTPAPSTHSSSEPALTQNNDPPTPPAAQLLPPSSYSVAGSQGPTPSLETVLQDGYKTAGASPIQLVIRATPIQGTTRCAWRGIARTTSQRAEAVRMWLDLGPDEELPTPQFIEVLFTGIMEAMQPENAEILKSNFRALARGGLSEEYLFLTCFTDHTVHEYILGAGPATLTTAHDQVAGAPSYQQNWTKFHS